jgi:hypothetical protein
MIDQLGLSIGINRSGLIDRDYRLGLNRSGLWLGLSIGIIDWDYRSGLSIGINRSGLSIGIMVEIKFSIGFYDRLSFR